MEKQKSKLTKILSCISGILILCSFLFFAWGESTQTAENELENDSFKNFEGQWVRVMDDGSTEPMPVPGKCDAEKGEWVTIQTILPKDQQDTWICMRSMQQDMYIYVGDELRKKYSTLETQPFGKTSTMTYVFFEVYADDAGETLRVEFMSDSHYAGYVSDVYEGDRYDTFIHFLYRYVPSAIVSSWMMLVGIFVIAGSIFVRFYYKRKADLLYLGEGLVIAAAWMLVESKIRQFFLPNSTIAMLTGFLMIAVVALPFMWYMNSVQKGRHQKAYHIIGVGLIINYVLILTLQLLGIKDFFESMSLSHFLILAFLITMMITIIYDIVKGYIGDYKEVAIGFAALMLAAVIEILLSHNVAARSNGIALCFGLMMLLISAGLKSVKDLLNIEKEKQLAIAAGEAKAKFLANMSHEIRTPINAVIGMNEMILRENQDETIAEYANNIKDASQTLLSLINEILDFSKIDAGKLDIVENEYSTRGMLKEVILGAQLRATKKDLSFDLDIDDDLPKRLIGDEVRIKQILNNLLSNAIKYTKEGNVTLSAKGLETEKGFVLEFSVKDTGIGIKKEDMERLFDSFQRLELGKNRYIEGTGLGLNITQQLVALMKGTIGVESEYGKGSCFTVRIPQQMIKAVTEESDAEQQNAPTDETKPVGTLCIPNAKILAVDDTEMNLFILKGLLKRTQAQLDLAGGGEECFAKTKEKKYDIILMDHMMPEPDGIATLHMIREDEDNPNKETPVIMLTANAIEGVKEGYLAEGFEDYLSKPVEVDKLESMLAKYLTQNN